MTGSSVEDSWAPFSGGARPARLARGSGCLLQAGALLGWSAPPATAVSVFDDDNTGVVTTTQVGALGRFCGGVGLSTTPDVRLPVLENGPVVTTTGTATLEGADETSPDFKETVSGTSTVQISTAAGNVGAVEAHFSGRAATNGQGRTACNATLSFETLFYADFTVATPGFLTIEIAKSSSGPTSSAPRIDATLFSGTGPGSDVVGGDGPAGTISSRSYLPVDRYYLDVTTGLRASTFDLAPGVPILAEGTLVARFTVAGAQLEPTDGRRRGQRYASLPDTRSCSTGTLEASLSARHRRIGRIRSVRYELDGEPVKRIGRPKPGQSVSIPVTEGEQAHLSAVIRTSAVPGQGPSTRRTVSATYEACR